MSTLNIDIETYSPVDLIKSGVYAYSEHPEFEILLFAYAFDGGEVRVIDIASGEKVPEDVMQALEDESVLKTAFNASFERTCINNFFCLQLPTEQWECTMVKAAMCGLPLSLAAVANVLRLEQKKMVAGKALIRYFSLPCKPTKTNGMRARNLPHHDADKWEMFKKYCGQDVVTERAIRTKIRFFEIPEFEKRLYILDQDINDRGVMLDREFIQNAISIDIVSKERLTAEAIALTGLDNPNSPAQLKQWIERETGVEVKSLSKETIPALLENSESDYLTRVLELRQEMAKTSVKKYEAMASAICSDNRVRGLLQFYGANRTGRWAGRLVQVQNLPQNHLEDLDLARKLVSENDTEMLEMLFGNIPDTLSQLIRTAFIAKPGYTFLVADFSAIEARVIAWLAGEKWRLDAFNRNEDIYCASAAMMFGVVVEKHGTNGHLRQKGKISELACIAEGQLVLTNKGLIPIEEVTTSYLVWDGVEFVWHGGVIYKGIKEVVYYEGLTATTDHLVWIDGQSEPVQFGYAAESGSHLLQSGNCRKGLRTCKNNITGKEICEGLERCKGLDTMRRVRGSAMDPVEQSFTRQEQGVSNLLTNKASSSVAGSENNSSKTTLRESKGQELSQLRSKGDPIQIPLNNGSRTLDNRNNGLTRQNFGDGPDGQQRGLRKGKYPICGEKGESSEPETDSTARMDSRRLALCEVGSDPEAILGINKVSDNYGGGTRRKGETKELERNRRKAKVYDILKAGPRNRFTVSGVLVHNCGYGGGVGALTTMGALKMGLEESELQPIINAWRAANPHIVELWKAVEKAAMEAVENSTSVDFHHGIRFEVRNNILFILLPSGRRLAYVRPSLGENRFGGNSLKYEGMNQTTKQWCVQETYGGKLVENIVQAIARDLLAESMVAVDKAGYQIVMHVHDENIIEVEKEKADLKEVCRIMGQPIAWAPGLPLRADGYSTDYYMKD